MTEEFIHYLWKFRLLFANLKLVSGEPITILDPGIHNTDSGPDFFSARIRIGETTWAGNIEIHLKSSLWYEHKHHKDKAYENVILHVVHVADEVVRTQKNLPLPTLAVGNQYNASIFECYKRFMTSRNWIACENIINEAERFVVNSWLDRMLFERLETKAAGITAQLRFNKNDWERTFYEFLARNFGFKVNALPFDLLAKSIPLKYLAKHHGNLMKTEAFFFGQAGLIPLKTREEYPANLLTEYRFLQSKYRLIPMDAHLWRFMRLRPSNFPTIRISQFAGLINRSSHLFSGVLEATTLRELMALFEVTVSGYWTEHFRFGKKSAARNKSLGTESIRLIIVNTVIPFIFVYGQTRSDQRLIDRCLRFLEQIPGESNRITRKWETLGMSCRTSFNTQALLHLKSEYCSAKKCLSCSIGNELLKQSIVEVF